MKVVFYDQFSLDFQGGGEIWLVNTAQTFAKMGASVTVLTLSKGSQGHALESVKDMLAEDPRFSLMELEARTLPMGIPLPSLASFRTLYEQMAVSDIIYVIHGHPVFEIPLLLLLKLRLRKRVIAAYEGPLRPSPLPLRLLGLWGARLMVRTQIYTGNHVLNEADLKTVRAFGARNAVVIPNGVSPRLFHREEEAAPSTKFVVLFVGRLSDQKGFDLFCRTIRALNSDPELDSHHFEFRIAGSGPMTDLLDRVLARASNVRYLGHIPHVKMAATYSSAAILLAPYRFEGQPLAVLEAQACGLPVVAFDLPGIREALLDRETGILVREYSVDAFVEAVKQLYREWSQESERFELMRKRARENASRFSWQRVTEQMMDLVSDVLETPL